MDIMPFSMCRSNLGWQTNVRSSDGKKEYTVSFEQLPPTADTEYGFTCTCPRFKFHPQEECKHIQQAKSKFCGWHEQHDGGEGKDGKCPKCGGETVGVMCAV